MSKSNKGPARDRYTSENRRVKNKLRRMLKTLRLGKQPLLEERITFWKTK